MEDPEKLPIGIYFNGRSHTTWHYRQVPPGMRPATVADLYMDRPVLHAVRIGPHAGDYYTDFVRESTYGIFRWMIEHGQEVYVKD